MLKLQTAMTVALAAATLLAGEICGATLIVFDRATLVNRPVQLAVLTKGRLFPKGGQLVTLSVGGSRLKQILTGGDGYGYLMYTPAGAGLKTVAAACRDESESGKLLVMAAHERAILIDVETALRRSALAPQLREGSREALTRLNQHFRIVYLYGMTGLVLTRSWLNSNGLPPSVVLPWRNAGVIKTLERQGIRQHAVIGSASQMKAAENTIQNRFSFENTQNGPKIDTWSDVVQALGLKKPGTE